MADPDRDTQPEQRTDPMYDNWPVEDYDAWSNWDVEREVPRDEGTLEEVAEQGEVAPEHHWVGMTGTDTGTAYVYDGQAIYEGDLDEEEERIRLREESRSDVDDESLGERIEELGQEHGWTWLSSFAREHLEDDDQERRIRGTGGVELYGSEFDRRNVADDAEYEQSFTGSHTFEDESGQKYILDRQIDVYEDRKGPNRVFVEVDENYLLAEEPLEEERRGDAEIVDERTREFELEIDTDQALWENELEAQLKEWHYSNLGIPRKAT